MPELTIDIDDAGNIGTLPAPLQQFLDGRINDAYKRGAEKVEKELAGTRVDPAERERLKLLEQENARFREQQALAEKNYQEAHRLQEERLSKIAAEKDDVLKAKEAEIARRDARLRDMLGAEIRAAAVAAGAREESLPELSKLLGADLDLDADLQPFVRGTDGGPRLRQGVPVTIEGWVADYLAAHPHHLRAGRSQSGRAAGGATFGGGATSASPAEDALAALAKQPTAANVAKTLGALRTARA